MAKITRNSLKKKFTSPIVTVVLFFLAAVMLLGSTIGGTRAALTFYSENYTSEVELYNIGVQLLENGVSVARSGENYLHNGTEGKLLENLLGEDKTFFINKEYQEELQVVNNGSIDQYVRVTIYKYWKDAEGEKTQELLPEWIILNLVNVDSENGTGEGQWLLDSEATTEERIVLYYKEILPAEGGMTEPLSSTLKVDDRVAFMVTRTEEKTDKGTTYKTTFDYDGCELVLEARVDAVQTHSAEDAILSAWGVRVRIDENGFVSELNPEEEAEPEEPDASPEPGETPEEPNVSPEPGENQDESPEPSLSSEPEQSSEPITGPDA